MQETNFDVMENMPVHKAILTLSVPALITTVISLIYNLTDAFFIGLLEDPIQLGAISLAFPVFMIIQSVGNIFGQGAPSYISRCLGGKNYEVVKRTSSVSAYIAVSITLILTAVYFAFRTPILGVLGTSENNIEPTGDYLNIIIGFGFVMTLQVALPAFLRAEGKVKGGIHRRRPGYYHKHYFGSGFILVLQQGVYAGIGICLWVRAFRGVQSSLYFPLPRVYGRVYTGGGNH